MVAPKAPSKKKGKKTRSKRLGLWVVLASLLVGVVCIVVSLGYVFYLPNINPTKNEYELLLPRESNFDFLVKELRAQKVVKNNGSFWWACRGMRYGSTIKPGRYLLKRGMTNYQVIRKLQLGQQDAIELKFRSHHFVQEIVRDLDPQLEISADEITRVIEDRDFMDSLGIPQNQVAMIFIPNTYKELWNVSARSLIKRMKQEYDKFWTEERKQKAENHNLKPSQVMVLASIVQGETNKNKEKPCVAGVYLNRLRKGMRLEADPTVIFAHGDYSIRRVLKKHLEIDSPYNTYKYSGLPPGPIYNPEISSIDAVLNADSHDYIFFCAKSDFSGYHTFTKTLREHLNAANDYHNALNKRR